MIIDYYQTLKSNPHFSFRDFAILIKEGVARQQDITIDKVRLGEFLYDFTFLPRKMRFVIEWREGGQHYRREVSVLAERSNLPLLEDCAVYYFICPSTGYKCRDLYKIGTFFVSRRAIKAYYPSQLQGRLSRSISYTEEPYRRYGKMFYRGKLTPYGKRCLKYQRREEYALAHLFKSFYN